MQRTSDRKTSSKKKEKGYDVRPGLPTPTQCLCCACPLPLVLTGTPIQNRLEDFGALLSFIRIVPFQYKHALDIFVLQKATSSSFNRWWSYSPKATGRLIKEDSCLLLLRSIVAPTCLRQTKAMYAKALSLTQKQERVELVNMDGRDRDLYSFFQQFSLSATMGEMGGGDEGDSSRGKNKVRQPRAGPSRHNAFTLLSMLRLICDHGEDLLPASARSAWANRNFGLLTLQMLNEPRIISRSVGCERDTEDMDTTEAASLEEFVCGHVMCETFRISRGDRRQAHKSCPRCGSSTAASSSPEVSQESTPSPFSSSKSRSAKLKALLCNLTEYTLPGSQTKHCWTKMLDLVANALSAEDITFCRIDGQSSLTRRREALALFALTDANAKTPRIMLATIGAAGEGIDLTAANTVHLVEPHWNPMAESQAVDRIHHIGQLRDVTVIRYIVKNSVETYIQYVQNEKLEMIRWTFSPSDMDPKNVAASRFEKLLPYLEQ